MFSVNTNTNSIVTRNYLELNQNSLSKAMERLSSGKRINSSADDAAGLAISTRLTSQSRGMSTANRNAQDGMSMIQTADSALGTVTDILQRIRELAVQADNGTYSSSDLSSIQTEISQLISEINHVANNITFNGIPLMITTVAVTLHISDKYNDTISLSLTDARITVLGIGAGSHVSDISVTLDAQGAISIVDKALDTISTTRAGFGAVESRLSFIVQNLTVSQENTDQSKSRIQDADMAAESSNMTKAQILTQTSMAMLQKANQTRRIVAMSFCEPRSCRLQLSS